jgi:hypothetical protein
VSEARLKAGPRAKQGYAQVGWHTIARSRRI